MWESPIYKVKAKIDGNDKDILIDVTGSAPNFTEPKKQLEGTFGEVLKGLTPSSTKILDFGAAKLRNTLYLLKKGYTVYSCEFKELFNKSKQAKEFYEECVKYSNFKPLIFPDDFIDLDEKFDVILLVNVLNIMPVPIERFCVLYLCRKKIKENGRLLWYTQHGMYSERDAVGVIYDGLVTGKGREYNMFYRDFSRKEIHEMLESTGFSYNKDFKFPMSGTNQAYLFSPTGEILIDKTLGLSALLQKNKDSTLKKIERETRWGVEDDEIKSVKVVYETKIPKRITKLETPKLLETYLNELNSLKAGGGKKAPQYHKLIFNILKSVFENKLKKPEIEEYLAKKTQRADITFQNERECGFFKQLDEGYHITCPNIFIECKNYNGDIANPEFSQIQNRLNKHRGQFGIIVCRKIMNIEKAKLRQENLKNDDKYVIVFTDKDIETLVKLKLDSKEEEIDEFIENKFKELI
jgi:hypothetical protein